MEAFGLESGWKLSNSAAVLRLGLEDHPAPAYSFSYEGSGAQMISQWAGYGYAFRWVLEVELPSGLIWWAHSVTEMIYMRDSERCSRRLVDNGNDASEQFLGAHPKPACQKSIMNLSHQAHTCVAGEFARRQRLKAAGVVYSPSASTSTTAVSTLCTTPVTGRLQR